MTLSMIYLPRCAVDVDETRCDLRLVIIDTQTVVSVISPSASLIVLSAWKRVCIVLDCDVHSVLSYVSGLRVCICTSLMTSGGRRGAITVLLTTSYDYEYLVYSVF